MQKLFTLYLFDKFYKLKHYRITEYIDRDFLQHFGGLYTALMMMVMVKDPLTCLRSVNVWAFWICWANCINAIITIYTSALFL